MEDLGRGPYLGRRAIKCHVGALQKAIKVATVTWRKGNRPTPGEEAEGAYKIIGLSNRRNQAGSEGDAVGRLVDRNLHDRELVASQACNAIGLPPARSNPFGPRLQQGVSDRVTKRIVHFLEMIEIKA